MQKGLRLAEASPTQLAFRGTARAGSVRCDWRGIARTLDQRERAIRSWLKLDDDAELPSAPAAERLFLDELARINPIYPATVTSNFIAMARGGLSTEFLFLTCHADYTVHEFLLGSGATGGLSSLTVSYDRLGEARSYKLYRLAHSAGEFGDGENLTEGEYESELRSRVQAAETNLSGLLEGREGVVFLAPMGAHNAIAIEAWQAVAQWDLQTDDQGTVYAVRYWTSEGDPEHTQSLAKLKSRITAAASKDKFAGKRIANASGLTQYYRGIGAYGDITPDDGSNETFTPAQPPAVLKCAGGRAVADAAADRALVHDCENLLNARDTLRGTANLNWREGRTISRWSGVSTGGTPSRVTRLTLRNKGLSGSIPADLGRLSGLTRLDLRRNSLTGEIPRELGWLHNLTFLKLSGGNSFTGCLPISLKDIATNDLASLNLLYCRPPAPSDLRASEVEETGVTLNWTAVSNAGKYRVEYRAGVSGDWTLDDESITSTSHTVDGLTCETEYRFRAGAYGSGTVYAAAWSEPSATLKATTAMCTGPKFGDTSYAFQAAGNAKIGTVVGTVSATDPDDETLTYSIESGNDDGKFAIGSSSGEITVAGSLDREDTPSYALKVRVSDGDQTDVAEVTIDLLVEYDVDGDGLIEIGSLAQLNAVRWDLDGDGKSSNAGYATAYPDAIGNMGCPASGCKGYELTADLDFDSDDSGEADASDDYWNGGSGWLPIGTRDAPFNASFHGNGHTISSLFIDRDTADHVGLFGGTGAKSALRDVALLDVRVTGRDHAGALVGAGAVAGSTIAGSYGVGVVSGRNSVGGLVGSTHGKVAASRFTGAVNGRGNVGGLAGELLSSTAAVTDSYADALIQATYENVGGLIGRALGGAISRSYASGDVNALGGWYSGGLVGRNAASVTDTYALGDVNGRAITGGLIGHNDGTLTRTYAQGSVTSPGNKVGGLVAQQNGGAINESYSTGRVAGVGDKVGGLIGTWRGGAYKESIWDTETSGQATSDVGWARTSSQMRSPTSNTGAYRLWSATAWDYGTAGQYPALKADWNGDGTATWQEFGPQRVPSAPAISGVAWKRSESDGLRLAVSWSAPAWDGGSPITSYDVRHIATGDEQALPSNWTLQESAWTGGALTYAITGLEAGRRVVQVRAVNANGNGRWSAGASPTGNSPPSFNEASPARTVAENTTAGVSIGEPVSATDPDGDDLAYSLAGTDAASFEIDASTGQLKTSAPLNYEKRSSYRVSVEVSDGSGTASVDVSVAVTDANDPPLANADAVSTNEATALAIAVLENDTDEDPDDSVALDSVTQPPNGKAEAKPDGTVTYTPNAGFHGADAFKYTATDGVNTVEGDVTVTVKPVCSNGTAVPSPADHAGLVRDCTTLLALKDALAGSASLNWSASVPISTWTGVTVSGSSDRVSGLRLPRLKLNGRIPAELSALSALERLNLGRNRLTGSVPADLGKLANLISLNLDRNRLSGSIPGELGGLSNLKILNLSSNRLDGSIPTQLGSMARLTELRLNGNGLDGAIPSQLGSLTRLKRLILDENDLSGCIPTELGTLTNLEQLRLSGNRLTGSIPAAIREFELEDPTPAELRQALNLPWSDAPGAPVCGPPTIAGAPAITSTPAAGDAYSVGENITVSVTFSEAVTVGGTPRLALHVGSVERWADYASGSNTKTLKFSYAVVAGDDDGDGVSVGENKLALNGGTIRDSEENDADLNHPALADQTGHKVDTAIAVTLHLSETSVAEAGGAATVTASLNRPSGTAVTVTVSVTPGPSAAAKDYVLSENTDLVIAANATASTGKVTITAVDNDVDAADKKVTVSGSVDATGVTAPDDVALTITDDDTAGVSAFPSRRYVSEGHSASYSVVLLSQPTGNVTVTPASNNAAVTAPSALTFTPSNWNTPQRVRALAVEDDNVVGESVRIEHTPSGGGYDGAAGWTVIVYVADNDRSLVFSSDTLTVAESGTTSYTVKLSHAPTGTGTVEVKVTPRSLDPAKVAVSGATLTFTTTNWNTPQTVTVTSKSDDDGDDENVEIVHAVTGGGYDGQATAPTVTVKVTDDDEVPAKPAEFAAEAGEAGVTLSWNDPSDRSITGWQYRQKTGTGDYGDWTQVSGHTTSDSKITFTVSGLNSGQAYTFQVRAVNAVGDGEESDASTATPAPS